MQFSSPHAVCVCACAPARLGRCTSTTRNNFHFIVRNNSCSSNNVHLSSKTPKCEKVAFQQRVVLNTEEWPWKVRSVKKHSSLRTEGTDSATGQKTRYARPRKSWKGSARRTPDRVLVPNEMSHVFSHTNPAARSARARSLPPSLSLPTLHLPSSPSLFLDCQWDAQRQTRMVFAELLARRHH